MGWFRRSTARLRTRSTRNARAAARHGREGRGVDNAVATHLAQFAATRRGVEAYIEPKTMVTQTTLLLVAHDGEWTRRAVPSPEWAYAFAEHLKIPGYDAAVVGYPQRMRDYNSRKKKQPEGL